MAVKKGGKKCSKCGGTGMCQSMIKIFGALPDGLLYTKMPLTKKGTKIKKAMEKEYGKKKGDIVFYASQNKGTIKGTHKKKK